MSALTLREGDRVEVRPRTGQPLTPLADLLRDAIAASLLKYLEPQAGAEDQVTALARDIAADAVAEVRKPPTGYNVGPNAIEPDTSWFGRDEGDWRMSYRLAGQQGRVVVSEIRIYPKEADQPEGRWSTRNESVPAGGLGAGVLRHVRPSAPLQALTARSRDDIIRFDLAGVVNQIAGTKPPPGPVAVRRAQVAAAYGAADQFVRSGHNEIVARVLHFSVEYVRDVVHDCRGYDGMPAYLTPPPGPRRPGGAVTQAAKDLLGEDELRRIEAAVYEHIETYFSTRKRSTR